MNFVLLFRQKSLQYNHILQDGNYGEQKVKRLKSVKDEGMTSSNNDDVDTIYGALVVLGYNGSLLDGERKRRHRTSFILRKKGSPSGVQPYKLHLASSNTGMQVCLLSVQIMVPAIPIIFFFFFF